MGRRGRRGGLFGGVSMGKGEGGVWWIGDGGWEGWTFFVCAEGSVGGLVGDFVEDFVHFAFFLLGLFGGCGDLFGDFVVVVVVV